MSTIDYSNPASWPAWMRKDCQLAGKMSDLEANTEPEYARDCDVCRDFENEDGSYFCDEDHTIRNDEEEAN